MTRIKVLFSIKTKFSILICLLITTAIMINFIFLTSISKSIIGKNTESTVLDLVVAHSAITERIVESINTSTDYIANSKDIINYTISPEIFKTYDVESIRKNIEQYISKNEYVSELSIVNRNGKILLSSNNSIVGKDISKEKYISKALSEGVSSQSDLVVSDLNSEYVIKFANPIIFSNDVIGTIDISVNIEKLSEGILNVNVLDTKSSYAYMVDSIGNMIYHPTAEKIAKPVENSVIKDVVTRLNNGEDLTKDVVVYNYDGSIKYAGYYVLPNSWTIIVTADQNEILLPIYNMSKQSLIISIILISVFLIIGYIFATTITRPIKKITSVIEKTSKLDLIQDNSYKYLLKKSDETGKMGRAIFDMRNTISDMIHKIKVASDNIYSNSNSLNEIASKVNENTEDNSSTAQQLSAGMEETASTTEQINQNALNIDESVNEIVQNTFDASTLSKSLTERAIEFKKISEDSTQQTQTIYAKIKQDTELALEQAKSVENIGMLAKVIMDIAEETELLSINASIEAARAGDAGKGFAVVAQEIGKLANQSSQTVNNIRDVVKAVNSAVENITENSQNTLEFLDKKVLNDYSNFLNISEQYKQDSMKLNNTMEMTAKSTDILAQNILKISDSIAAVSATINQAAIGTVDLAEKNTEISSLTADVFNMAQQSIEYASILDEIVKKFKL